MRGKPEIRGIERFVVEEKDCPTAANPGTSIAGLKARFKMGKLSSEEQQKYQAAIHKYIDALHERLVQDLGRDKANQVSALLKVMTLADPAARPSMDEVRGKWESIGFS